MSSKSSFLFGTMKLHTRLLWFAERASSGVFQRLTFESFTIKSTKKRMLEVTISNFITGRYIKKDLRTKILKLSDL